LICLLLPFRAVRQGRELPDIQRSAERQGPTVVNIVHSGSASRRASPNFRISKKTDSASTISSGLHPPPPGPRTGPARFSRSRSLGSGFIIQPDGYVLTKRARSSILPMRSLFA